MLCSTAKFARLPCIAFLTNPSEDIMLMQKQLQARSGRNLNPEPSTIHAQVYHLASKYFGRWAPSAQRTDTAGQDGSAKPSNVGGRFEQAAAGGPGLMKAFYRPAVSSPDAVILEVIGYVPPRCSQHVSWFSL